MLNRQKIVVALLQNNGGEASAIQLVKWCFLLSKEAPEKGGDAFYEFLPYLRGPYSFGLYFELGALERDGLLRHKEGSWTLTDAGRSHPVALATKLRSDVSFVKKSYSSLPESELLSSVYERYPWFTINAKNEEKRAYPRPVANPKIYTAGYERLQVDGFLNLLIESGIERLIDVRANAVARRYGFHRNTLDALCQKVGIEYQHVPAIGIPSAWRSDLKNLSDYEALFSRYEQEIIPIQEKTIEQIAQWQQEKASVLVCQEADPLYCHRARVANAIAQITDLKIEHLGWPR